MAEKQIATYERVYAVVQQIPNGKVATYGQVASIVGNCTARMAGYAMAATPADYDVPWHRVINAQGKISPRARSENTALQQQLLEEEGVRFSASNRVDFKQVRWEGPSIEWMIDNGYEPAPSWRED